MMAKIVVINHLTVDGVMQSPGRPEEDTRGGFSHGGWGSRNSDEEMLEAVYAREPERRAASAAGPLDVRGDARLLEHPGQPVQRRPQHAPKYVASRTLREPLRWPNSRLLKGEAGDAVAELKQRASGDLFVMGSGELIETLMRRNLIDEYLLVIHPLVLGTGRRMFADGAPPTTLRLTYGKTTAKGVLIATYQTVVDGV
jgi:RibD C-terminal domain